MQKKSILVGVLVISFLGWVGPWGVGLWIKREIQSRLQMTIDGNLWPSFFQPSFQLKRARLVWPDRLKMKSGDLKIDYDPAALLSLGRLHIKIEGRDLSVTLLGDWAASQGVSDLKFHDFFADLDIGQKGLEEVTAIRAHSPLLNLDFTPQSGDAEFTGSEPSSKSADR
ncbi:MAG TPA: hypothetical protein VD913_00950 [bacterium]|nr:hypothetical protein [bacterium]